MKKSIYQITNEYQDIASKLEEGELTPELENQLAISQEELQNKAICYGFIIKSFDDDLSAIDEEIKRLQTLKKSKSNAIDRLKQTVKSAMEIYGIEKVETPTLKLSFRKSESLEIINESQIPAIFRTSKVVESIDKMAIKACLKRGETVEGAVIQENNNLQIK